MSTSRPKGEFDKGILGTVKWRVDFYDKGPPPTAIVEATKAKADRFRELLKLIDIKENFDARCILIIAKELADADLVDLATRYGIYISLNGDSESLRGSLAGIDVPDVNRVARESVSKRNSRKISEECREEINALLESNAFTYKELLSSLNYKYKNKIIYNQIRHLLSKKRIIILGRTSLGEGIYGHPGNTCNIRADMSRASKVECLSKNVLALLNSSKGPLTTSHLAVQMQCSRHLIRAIVRNLSKENKILRQDGGWAPRRDGKNGERE